MRLLFFILLPLGLAGQVFLGVNMAGRVRFPVASQPPLVSPTPMSGETFLQFRHTEVIKGIEIEGSISLGWMPRMAVIATLQGHINLNLSDRVSLTLICFDIVLMSAAQDLYSKVDYRTGAGLRYCLGNTTLEAGAQFSVLRNTLRHTEKGVFMHVYDNVYLMGVYKFGR